MGLRMLAASVASLVLAGTSACGGESRQPAGGEPADFAYMVSISGERDFVEWVAPGPGWWRQEGRDASGCLFKFVRAEDRYLTRVSCGLPYVRIGSPEFLGPGLMNVDAEAIALPALLRRREIAVGDQIHLKQGDSAYVLTIQERIPLAEARGLFTVSTKGAGRIEQELEPGTRPTIALRAYWFGPSIGPWTAETAVQDESDEDRYETFYELPSAEGESSATGKPPEGEIQVVSAPLDSRSLRRRSTATDVNPSRESCSPTARRRRSFRR